jgi:hypothetical protein
VSNGVLWITAVLGLAVVLNATSSCGGGVCNIQAASYDQSCARDADCVAVEGNLCGGGCNCENAAINVSAQQQYATDESKKNGNLNSGCPCAFTPAWCNGGLCSVAPIPPGHDAGGD